MRNPAREREQAANARLAQFIGLAILVHMAAIPVVSELIPAPTKIERKVQRVRMVTLPPGGAHPKQRRDLPRTPPEPGAKQPSKAPEPAEKKKEKEEKLADAKGVVVDVPPSADDRAPEDAQHLSEHNTRTERETVSRHKAKDYVNATNEPTIARRSQASAPERGGDPRVLDLGPDDDSKASERKEKQEARPMETLVPKIEQRDRLALKLDPSLGTLRNQHESEAVDGKGKRLRLSLGQDGQQEQQPGSAPQKGQPQADLIPRLGVLSRLSGAPANEHLPDLEEGEGTFLNSREFKYASFMNRLKRGVSHHWNPLPEYRRRDPTGNIYGHMTRITVVQVVLEADGRLKDLQVTRSSGLDFLDYEAMGAIKRAEPFLNPPKGMINEQGEISFPFAFYVEFNSRGLRLPF